MPRVGGNLNCLQGLVTSIDPRSVNPIEYAASNPMRFFDPLGLEDDLDQGMDGLIAVAAVLFTGEIPNLKAHEKTVKMTKFAESPPRTCSHRRAAGEPPLEGRVVPLACLGRQADPGLSRSGRLIDIN